MSRFLEEESKSKGLPPGTPIYIGEDKVEKVRLSLFNYDEKNYEENYPEKIEDVLENSNKSGVTWINIDGIHDINIIEAIGRHFNLHPLTLEDIMDTNQRPKIDDFDDYLYVVIKMLYFDEKKREVDSEQVSLILGKNYVISFQEKIGDVFEPIRDRIRNNKGRVRKLKSDYLAYVLIDSIVDNYFSIIEKYGDKMEEIEEELIDKPTHNTLNNLHKLKREMIFLRKSVWPLREMINGMIRSANPLIKKTTDIFLRDVYDHTIQVMDTIESFRDTLSGIMDIYLSSLSNKMNQVMKVLTIIATIFIPLTFIAGVYGMNFKNMPELNWKIGYPIILGFMFIVAIIMLLFFRRKKWL